MVKIASHESCLTLIMHVMPVNKKNIFLQRVFHDPWDPCRCSKQSAEPPMLLLSLGLVTSKAQLYTYNEVVH